MNNYYDKYSKSSAGCAPGSGCLKMLEYKLNVKQRVIGVLICLALLLILTFARISHYEARAIEYQREIDLTYDVMNDFVFLEELIINSETLTLRERAKEHLDKYSNYVEDKYSTYYSSSYKYSWTFMKPLIEDIEYALSENAALDIISRLNDSEKERIVAGEDLSVDAMEYDFKEQRPAVAAALQKHLSYLVRAHLSNSNVKGEL